MKLVELCHIYWSDYLSGKMKIDFQKERQLIASEKASGELKTVVLIDDHHRSVTEMPPRPNVMSDLKDFFASEEIDINAFFFESDCAEYAFTVLQNLPQECLIKESFDRGTSSRTFFVKDGKKIPLFKEETINGVGVKTYTCPLLSAVWVLIKHDIIPLLKVAYRVTSLATILPEGYRSTEDDVACLLAEAGFIFTKPDVTHYY